MSLLYRSVTEYFSTMATEDEPAYFLRIFFMSLLSNGC